MNDTTQEELPPLPTPRGFHGNLALPFWTAYELEAYARQCIATLKAENARLVADLEDTLQEALRNAAWAQNWKLIAGAGTDDAKQILEYLRRSEAAQSQAAAMARLLEEAQNCIHSAGQFLKRHPATVKELMPFVEETENMWERINAALATWKGSGKDLP